MHLSWTNIVNTVKKDIQVGEKIFIRVEPFAVTALNIAGLPAISGVLASIYNSINRTEVTLQGASGQDKFQTVESEINDIVLPILHAALGAKVSGGFESTVSTIINSIVTENNAQAELSQLLTAAANAGQPADKDKVASVQKEIAEASARVLQAGTILNSLFKKPVVPAVTVPTTPVAPTA